MFLSGDRDGGGHFLDHALQIAGVLHIFANCLKDIDSRLAHWNAFHGMLKTLEKLISIPERMQRLVATCVRGSAFDTPGYIHICQRRYSIMYDKRWGEVHKYCIKVDRLMPILRQCWDEKKFSTGLSHKPDDDGGVFSAAAITEVVKSAWFLAYTRMVVLLGETVEALTAWAERCPCHDSVQRKEGEKPLPVSVLRAECGVELASQMTTLSCPMRGCRAAEVACGQVFRVLDEAWRHSLVELLLKCRRGLKADEWSQIVHEFEVGKGYCAFVLQVKLQVWEELPWRLCGLAHHSESMAREAAKDCMLKYDRLPFDHLHHKMTLKFLSPASRIRSDVEAFARGCSRDSLPRLLRAVAQLRGVPITERSIEAPHGKVKREICHKRHKAVSVTMSLRSADIERDICRSETAFAQLSAFLQESLSVRRVPRLLGVHGHPWLQALRGGKETSRQSSSWVSLLSCILYRCDDITAFETREQEKCRHDKIIRQRAGEARPFLSRLSPIDSRVDEDKVFNRAAIEHLRETTSTGDVFVYNLEGSQAMPSISTLRSHLQRPLAGAQAKAKAETAAGGDLELDVDDSADCCRLQDGTQICFSIVDTKPSNKKTQGRTVGAGQKAQHHQIAISLTQLHTSDTGAPMVDLGVGLLDEHRIALVSLAGSSNPWLRANLMVHKSLGDNGGGGDVGDVSYSIKDFVTDGDEAHAVNTIVQAMIQEVAFASTSTTYVASDAHTAVLSRMEVASLAQHTQLDDGTYAWQLTKDAISRTRVFKQLAPSTPALGTPEGLAIEDMTTYQQAITLLDRGWEWQTLPGSKTKKRAELLPYRVGVPDAKRVFYTGLSMIPEYLTCLLQADDLAGKGVDMIPHGLPPRQYQNMLKGIPHRDRVPRRLSVHITLHYIKLS